MSAMEAVTAALGGRLAFGGDYNPEQWPEEVHEQDVALMQEAGVNLVSVGIFSWALLEPEPGAYDLDWLVRVVDRLHAAGIAVDLATGTASPPPWFLQRHPDAALVDAQGVRRSFGSRQAYCPSAPAYREAAARLAGTVARRFADHPGVVMWHLNNEYGCHNWHCYCAASGSAFRGWLRGRYADPGALNEAWGTAFWSQRYTDWDQVEPPREVSYNSFANPGQQLDWWRFSSEELRACLQAEIDAVSAVSDKPLTTNFMGFFKPLDYRAWVRDLDPERYLVSNDHYLVAEDPGGAQQLAMTADLLRSVAGQRPWLLMEHSTSAVNWQPRNLAKRPGEMRRNSLQHIARGADGALFFQWRASRAGAEKYHSGMVPHAGTRSRLWRDVVQLGADVRALAEVSGTRTAAAPVALVFDWPSWWAAELDSHPSVDVDPLATARRWHRLCWERNIGVDVVGADDDLSSYAVVVLPVQYLLTDDAAARLEAFVRGGGTLVATYFSGIVDEHDHVRLGGYPGALGDLLGVRVEEFHPLASGADVPLSAYDAGSVWSELAEVSGAEAISSYAAGPCAGSPAVTRRPVDGGTAWYVGTELSEEGLDELGSRIFEEAGVRPVLDGLPVGVEAVRRVGATGSFLFVVNHTDLAVTVPVTGADLLTGRTGKHEVAPGGVAVLREDD